MFLFDWKKCCKLYDIAQKKCDKLYVIGKKIVTKQEQNRSREYMQSHDTAFIAPGAVVLGDVTIGENSGIWYNAVVRGDRDSIVIGRESNIQDNAVVHLGSGYPVEIGDHVTIGHGAIVHGCKIGDNTMIGMGAILMNGCKIGKNCIIGAGALVTQNVEIPDIFLYLLSQTRWLKLVPGHLSLAYNQDDGKLFHSKMRR